MLLIHIPQWVTKANLYFMEKLKWLFKLGFVLIIHSTKIKWFTKHGNFFHHDWNPCYYLVSVPFFQVHILCFTFTHYFKKNLHKLFHKSGISLSISDNSKSRTRFSFNTNFIIMHFTRKFQKIIKAKLYIKPFQKQCTFG